MSEPIRDLETAVRELGALPMPAGPEPKETSPRSFALAGEVQADDYDDAVYAAEQAYSGMRGQGYKGSISVDTGSGQSAAGADALELPGTALEHVQAILLAHFGELPRPDMAVGLLLTNLRTEWEAEGRARIADLEAAREQLVRWHDEDDKTIKTLVARVDRHRARTAELEALVEQATEFRLWEPGYGLYVRRAPGATGFAVMEARRTDKGRRAWTTAGWQYTAILSDAELFCWPDAQTAVVEARRVMPGVVGDECLSGPCDCGEGAVHYTAADCPAAQRAAEDVTPQVQKLRALLAGQREQAATDAPHEGPQRHTYRLGRDLPETGGAQ